MIEHQELPKMGSPEAKEMVDKMPTWGYFEWMSNHPGAPLHHIPFWKSKRELEVICGYSWAPTPEHPQPGGGMFELLVHGEKFKNPQGGDFWLEHFPTYTAYNERVKELQQSHDEYRRANRNSTELPGQVPELPGADQ